MVIVLDYLFRLESPFIFPKGERENHSFPLGGRLGRGSEELRNDY